ncbi:hypothetical protein PG985_013222 [Apiospora marii]|uniref:Uncharacterized protein n=1 Tax=Apiospora marii TaxID=335849 RepID=A0ABR1R8L9_9PEZI
MTASRPPFPALPRAMTPRQLPKLVIAQPDWTDETELRKNEAYIPFRREMALKRLLSIYDDWEIEEFLEFEDDHYLVIGALWDLGLEQDVHAESIRDLWGDFDEITGIKAEEVGEAEAESVLVDEELQEGEEEGVEEVEESEGDNAEGYEGDDEEADEVLGETY